jgi:hypothetical protein
MEASVLKGIRFSNAEDTKFKLNPAHEIEKLSAIIKQLQDKLSQCNLECDTERIAKRAVQRELASVRALLKNVQEEQCVRWTRSGFQSKQYDIASTNPFEADLDENGMYGSLELHGTTVTKILDDTDISIKSLETILKQVSKFSSLPIFVYSHAVLFTSRFCQLAFNWRKSVARLACPEKFLHIGTHADSPLGTANQHHDISVATPQQDDIGGVGLVLKEEQGTAYPGFVYVNILRRGQNL